MPINSNLKNRLQTLISAVNTSTPDDELIKLAVAARGRGFNTAILDAEVERRSSLVTTGTPLNILLKLALTYTTSQSHAIGEIVKLNPAFPPIYETEGRVYVKNTYAVKSGYDPALENHKQVITGFRQLTIPFSFQARDVIKKDNLILVVGEEGILRSIDNGATWASVSTQQNVKSVAENNGVFMAARQFGGVLVSTDNGATWLSRTCPAAGNNKIWVFRTELGFIVIPNGSYNGTPTRSAHITTDQGLTWRICDMSAINTSHEITAATSNGVDVFFATAVSGSSVRLYKAAVQDRPVFTLAWQDSNSSAPQISTMAAEGHLLFAGRNSNTGTIVSVDGGQTWQTFAVTGSGYWSSAILAGRLYTGYSNWLFQSGLSPTPSGISSAWNLILSDSGYSSAEVKACDGELLKLFTATSTVRLWISENAVGLDLTVPQGDDPLSYYMRVL